MIGNAEALVLFIDNTHALYEQKRAIEDNLLKRVANGSYQGTLARKAFSYLTETGAKQYVKELGRSEELSPLWHVAFPKKVRDEADKELVESFWTKVQTDSYFQAELQKLKSKGKKRGVPVPSYYEGEHPHRSKLAHEEKTFRTKNFTLEELRSLPTQAVGQADDLKIDYPNVRVWISRMTVEDGMPYNHQVTVEELKKGKWVTTRVYQARGARKHESRKVTAGDILRMNGKKR